MRPASTPGVMAALVELVFELLEVLVFVLLLVVLPLAACAVVLLVSVLSVLVEWCSSVLVVVKEPLPVVVVVSAAITTAEVRLRPRRKRVKGLLVMEDFMVAVGWLRREGWREEVL